MLKTKLPADGRREMRVDWRGQSKVVKILFCLGPRTKIGRPRHAASSQNSKHGVYEGVITLKLIQRNLQRLARLNDDFMVL